MGAIIAGAAMPEASLGKPKKQPVNWPGLSLVSMAGQGDDVFGIERPGLRI